MSCCSSDWEDFNVFCAKNGVVVSTVAEQLLSDSCGFLSRVVLGGYVRLKILIQVCIYFKLYILPETTLSKNTLSWPSDDYDEAHLCCVTLDRLTKLVEDGVLQTVVDKVFAPKDIEIALSYIQSKQSIGSSIVTFR